MKSKEIAMMGMLAALYAALVVLFAPISFQAYQVRVADMLLPLSILFGPWAALGLAIGAFIGNVYSPFGPVDMVVGAVANLIAAYLGWIIGSRRFQGSWVAAVIGETIMVSVVVSVMLAYLAALPPDTGPVLFLLGVLGGSIISIGIAGYILVRILAAVLPKSLLRRVL